MKLAAAIIGFIGAASIALGCGGGDGDALTRAEFIKQGDTICVKAAANRDVALEAAVKAHEKNGGGQSVAFTETLVTTALPPLDQMTQELADLEPPADDDKAVAVVKSFETAIARLEDDPGRALDENNPILKPLKLATAYGFKTCGSL